MSAERDVSKKMIKKLFISKAVLLIVLLFPLLAFSEEIILQKSGNQSALPDSAKVSERIFGLQGLSNVGKVAPGIYRGAQPKPEGYKTLKEVGIKTVINLRTSKSEKTEVEAEGMQSIEVPMSVLRDVKDDTVDKIIDMMIKPENQPVYVHCRQGQDRTGVVIAAYRMRIEKWPFKEAEAEMQSFGFNDLWYELKEFIRDYAKELDR